MRGKKLKKRKLMMFALAAIIGIANISMYSGNEEKLPEVIVVGEIDLTKPLDDQLENFGTIQVTKSDSQKRGNSIVRNLKELEGKRISVKLAKGSSVPRDVLIDGQGFGQFASETPENTTVFKIPAALAQLPKGIKKGDLIDIAIVTKDKTDMSLDMLMTNVTIHTVTETDVWVLVSQKNHGILTVSGKNAEFVLQLPGQKDVPNCNELTEKEQGQPCYDEKDTLDSIKFSEVMDGIKNGEIINSSEEESEEVENPETDATQSEDVEQEVTERQERDELLDNFNN